MTNTQFKALRADKSRTAINSINVFSFTEPGEARSDHTVVVVLTDACSIDGNPMVLRHCWIGLDRWAADDLADNLSVVGSIDTSYWRPLTTCEHNRWMEECDLAALEDEIEQRQYWEAVRLSEPM